MELPNMDEMMHKYLRFPHWKIHNYNRSDDYNYLITLPYILCVFVITSVKRKSVYYN